MSTYPLQGYEIGARYLPAAAGLAVGGDWFDAFPLPGGDLAVGVGDVAGHDLTVAATMGRLRSMLRALADDGALPSLVVSRLDRVATRLGVTRFTTLVHGHLVRAPTRDPENRAAADLLDLVSAHARRSLGEFCDELVRGTSADTDDDIAVLAVRLT